MSQPTVVGGDDAASLTRALRARTVGAIAIVVAALVGSFAVAVHQIERAQGLAELLNHVGRQRMLAHRIALGASDLESMRVEQPDVSIDSARAELEGTIREFEERLRMIGPALPASAADEWKTMRTVSEQFVSLASTIAEAGDEPHPTALASLKQLTQNRLLQTQDATAEVCALALERTILNHVFLLAALAMSLLLLLGVTGWFVLRPALARIEEDLASYAEALARDTQRLFEMSLDLQCIAGFDGTFKRVNPSSERILGYRPDELQGQPFLKFIHPDDLRATIAATEELASGQEVTTEFRNRYVTKSGDVRVLAWRSRAVPEQGLIYASATDITRERALLSELEHRARELNRSNQELDDFAYVASHDLRAPLRDIDNLAAWLEEDVTELLPPRSREHLQKIRRRIDRMEKLLNDLLEYSRVGRVAASTRLVDLDMLVRDVVSLASVPDSFEVTIDADVEPFQTPAAPLERVLLNLVTNAVKHHDEDAGNIAITASVVDDDVLIQVRDDGPGIEVQYHQRIFDLFRTLRSRDDVEGSGMGLAMIRKIVEFHGGDVTVASAPGQGSTFTVRWPRTHAPEKTPVSGGRVHG